MAQGTFYLLYKRAGAESDKSRGRHRGIWWKRGCKGCVEVKVFFLCDQVVQDVGSQCSNTDGLEGSTSPIIQRKLELDKVCVCVFLNVCSSVSLFCVFALCI